MPTPQQIDLAVGLARVEGKLDGFLSTQSSHGARIASLEKNLDGVAHDVTSLKATKAQGHNWVTTGLSVVGVVIAAYAVYLGVSP